MSMRIQILLFSIIMIFTFSRDTVSQRTDMFVPLNIRNAYLKNTRSMDGRPGTAYWQNRADYRIDVKFNPVQALVEGKEAITYYNNSPDTLRRMFLNLFPDYYKKGNARDFNIRFVDETEGVSIDSLFMKNGDSLVIIPDSMTERGHSGMFIRLPFPIEPGTKTDLRIAWHYFVNRGSHSRTGAVDSSSFFIAYFFPRLAVYDDISGWNTFDYTGGTEFYNDFGDFEVNIEVPPHYVLWATGELQNPEEVLQEKYVTRLHKAAVSDTVIHIIDSTEFMDRDITRRNASNTWRYRARNVSDFAFAVSDHYLWDAVSLVVDGESGRRVVVSAAYNSTSADFRHTVEIGLKGLRFMSDELPGVPFPYPNITVFNGLDEMEYPMMVNLVSYDNFHSTIRVTLHEIFHSYFPFYTGCNETLYAWMDEGLTTFATYVMAESLYTTEHAVLSFYDEYQGHFGDVTDVPIFVASDYLKRPVYYYTSYTKPAVFFLILRDVLGPEIFTRGLREFVNRWEGKHPQPYDLFFSLEDVCKKDLNWLIVPWVFEYGYVDLALGQVTENTGQYEITVENRGIYPAPVDLKIHYRDGKTREIHYTAEIWKTGELDYTLKISAESGIRSISLLNSTLLDADLSNNSIEF